MARLAKARQPGFREKGVWRQKNRSPFARMAIRPVRILWKSQPIVANLGADDGVLNLTPKASVSP